MDKNVAGNKGTSKAGDLREAVGLNKTDGLDKNVAGKSGKSKAGDKNEAVGLNKTDGFDKRVAGDGNGKGKSTRTLKRQDNSVASTAASWADLSEEKEQVQEHGQVPQREPQIHADPVKSVQRQARTKQQLEDLSQLYKVPLSVQQTMRIDNDAIRLVASGAEAAVGATNG